MPSLGLAPLGARWTGTRDRHQPYITLNPTVTIPRRPSKGAGCRYAPPRATAQSSRQRVVQAGTTTLEPPAVTPQQLQQAGRAPPPGKQRVVLVGSGWAAATFLKKLGQEPPDCELTAVSDRNYFLYTPLLPSTITGLVEERSIVEPMRALVHDKGRYVEAEVLSIDPHARTLTCLKTYCEVCQSRRSDLHKPDDPEHQFTLPYDVLLLSVGSVSNDFGVAGVKEHCWFLKSMEDAHALRVHLSKAFEQAALPECTPEERRHLLNLAIVGGGPTGCEVAAELHDFFVQDVGGRGLFSELPLEDLSITVIDTQENLLSSYDRIIQEYAANVFKRQGIQTMLGARVLSVDENELVVQSAGEESTLPFGTCVWATGVSMHPLVAALKESLAAPADQTSMQGLVVDSRLRVKGAPGGSIFALGDCAVFGQEKALAYAAELFKRGRVDGEGRMAKGEVVRLFKEAGAEHRHLGEFARQLEGGMLELAAAGIFGPRQATEKYQRHIERLERGVTLEGFKELIADMDAALRALPPTAQVARQEAAYLATLFANGQIKAHSAPGTATAGLAADGQGGVPDVVVEVAPNAPRFKYVHLGQLAYLGLNQAVLDLPFSGPLGVLRGWLVGEVWRGMEAWMQISMRNRLMVTMDWFRAFLFGRNMSDV